MTDPRPAHDDAPAEEPAALTADELQELEEKYDPEMRFRDMLQPVAIIGH